MATVTTYDLSGCACCPIWVCDACPPPHPIPADAHFTISGMADNPNCQAGFLTIPDSGANGSWQLGRLGPDLFYGPQTIGATAYKFTVQVRCVSGPQLAATLTVSLTGAPTASDYDQFTGDGLLSTPGNSCSPLNIAFTNIKQIHNCLGVTNVAYPGASWTLTA